MWKRVDVYLPRFSESQKSRFRSFSPPSFHDAEALRAPCRRSGDPPRCSWEGKLELTEVLRLLSQPREFQKVSTQENPEGSLKPALFMKVRCESARKRVPREAYLVSRMRRHIHTLSVLRFTIHEQRFTHKSGVSALAAELS